MEAGSLYERVGGRYGLGKLLHAFYADVRQHAVLGPIFNSHVADWKVHHERVVEFWCRVTGGPSFYTGAMPLRHAVLNLEPKHFEFWLGLWEWNCRRHLPSREAEDMIRTAGQIAERLAGQLGIQP